MNIECLLALACLSIYNLIHLPSVGSYYHPKSQEAMYKNLLVWERFGPLLPVVFIRVTIYHHFSVNMVKLKPFSRLFFRSIWQNITFQLTDNSNWDKLRVQSTNQVGGGSLRSFNYILVTLIQKKKCFRVIGLNSRLFPARFETVPPCKCNLFSGRRLAVLLPLALARNEARVRIRRCPKSHGDFMGLTSPILPRGCWPLPLRREVRGEVKVWPRGSLDPEATGRNDLFEDGLVEKKDEQCRIEY